MTTASDEVALIRTILNHMDRILEHRVRLAIAVLLSRHALLTFRRLKELTGESDGSLGAHLRKLEEAGYIAVRKGYAGRKPVTDYALSEVGLDALSGHLVAMEQFFTEALA